MRRSLFILALVFFLPGWAAAGEAPQVGSKSGSLVLEENAKDAKEARKTGASGDTLYDLLGQEVQVFIYNNKTRVWPKPVVISGMTIRSGSWGSRGGSGMVSRDPRLEAIINKYAAAYGVDPALVRAVIRNESGFNSGAVSPKGAQGLMQLMPGTAAQMGVRNPFDPEQNIAGGVGYLRHCLDRFGHNVPLAVAAYNAGPEAVAKYCSIPPYQETQLFVNNVMGSYGAYGPNKAFTNPAGTAPQPAPLGAKEAGKGAAPKAAAAQDKDKEQDKDAPRRRPRAKIIEVRSTKIQSKAISILKD